MRKRRANLTESEKAAVERRFRADECLKTIAADFNITTAAVSKIARARGVASRRRTGGVEVPWTSEMDDRLINLVELQHASWWTISKVLHKAPNVCATRYNQLTGGERREGIKSVAEIDAERNKRLGERAEERDRRALALLARDESEARRGVLTSSFFGDPPPGYSALDKRKPRLVSP